MKNCGGNVKHLQIPMLNKAGSNKYKYLLDFWLPISSVSCMRSEGEVCHARVLPPVFLIDTDYTLLCFEKAEPWGTERTNVSKDM